MGLRRRCFLTGAAGARISYGRVRGRTRWFCGEGSGRGIWRCPRRTDRDPVVGDASTRLIALARCVRCVDSNFGGIVSERRSRPSALSSASLQVFVGIARWVGAFAFATRRLVHVRVPASRRSLPFCCSCEMRLCPRTARAHGTLLLPGNSSKPLRHRDPNQVPPDIDPEQSCARMSRQRVTAEVQTTLNGLPHDHDHQIRLQKTRTKPKFPHTVFRKVKVVLCTPQ